MVRRNALQNPSAAYMANPSARYCQYSVSSSSATSGPRIREASSAVAPFARSSTSASLMSALARIGFSRTSAPARAVGM